MTLVPEEPRVRSAVSFSVVLLVTVLVPRLLAFPLTRLGPDEVAYGLIGREILSGSWPYTTAFDHKPAALYYPFAVVQMVFGSTVTALRVLSLVVAVASFVLVYVLCRRMSLGAKSSAALSGVYALLCLGNDGLAALSEPILNVYVLGILLVLTFRLTAWTGVLFGVLLAVAINTNYLIGPVLVVPGVYFLYRARKSPAALVAGVLGFVAGTAAILLPIALYSDIASYFNLQRSFLSVYDSPPVTWVALLRNVQDFLAPTLAVAMVPAVVLLVVRSKDRQPALVAWSLVFLLVSTATACYNGFFYPHYTIVIAPAVVAVGVVAAKGLGQRPAAVLVSSLMLVIAAWVMVVPILPKLESGTNAALAYHSLSPDADSAYSKVAQALGRVMRPGDLIYTMDVHDYYLSGARLPTKFFFPTLLLKPANAALLNSTPAAEVSKILAERPVVIVKRASEEWSKQVAGLVDAYVRDRCTLAERAGGAAIYSCRTG